MQTQFGFAFSGMGLVILLLVLVIYAGSKIRRQNPALFRKYVALVGIVGVIVPTIIVVVLNIPLPTQIELDITLDFKSNSTVDETTLQYHWEALGIQKDVYGIHIDWREQYGESVSYGAGAFHDLLESRVANSFYFQWTEFEPFANESWSLLFDFYMGIFEGQIILRGDNESVNLESCRITDDYFSSALLEGLESLGIQGVEIFMDMSFKISAQTLRSCFQENSIEIQISSDLQMVVNDIEFGIIPV
ncbi:MAG: hypothetical protein ACFFE6_03925 [Candidatus Thorarchaeota archaeon]